jgi:hypothetical protein
MHIQRNIRAALFLKAVHWRYLDGIQTYIRDLRGSPDAVNLTSETLADLKEALLCISSRLRSAVETTLDADFGDQPVSDHLRTVLQDLKLSSLKNFEHLRDIGCLVKALKREFDAVDCKKCGSGEKKYCKGKSAQADSELVRRGGLCFRWFLDIYKYYEKIGVRYCETVLSKHGLIKPHLHMMTEHCAKRKPHNFDHESDLNARTTFASNAMGLHSNIKLTLSMQMRRLTLAVIPYIVLHEILCHAYQKVGLYRCFETAERRERNKDCPFAEGWLAQISFRLMIRKLIPQFDRLAPEYIQTEYNLVHEECNNFHSERKKHDANFDNGAYYGDFFNIVFFSYSDMFGINGEDRGELDLAVLNIAFEFAFLINANATNFQMHLFMSLIERLLPSRLNFTHRAWLQLPLAEAAKEFLEKPNFERLLKNLEQIKGPAS